MKLTLYFFGDSIAFGQFQPPHKTWVALTSAAIEARFPACTWLMGNPSINGNTTRQALERMPFDVQAHRPDVLYVQFGLNDCNRWATDNGEPRVSKAGFRANLEEIINRALSSGVRCVLLATNHPSWNRPAYQHCAADYETDNKAYNNIIREVAAAGRAVTLVDHEKAWLEVSAPPAFLMSDGIHLSDRGHRFYAEVATPVIYNVVEKLIHLGVAR